MRRRGTSKGGYWGKMHDTSPYRSGLEDLVSQQLERLGVKFRYEDVTLPYVRPSRKCRYTPDFLLPNGIIVETKGRFVTADRQKMLQVKEQHPDLDIRIVFSNPSAPISKRSKTTYAMWCERYGFKYAKQFIPEAWLQEPPNKKAIKALKRFLKSQCNAE